MTITYIIISSFLVYIVIGYAFSLNIITLMKKRDLNLKYPIAVYVITTIFWPATLAQIITKMVKKEES